MWRFRKPFEKKDTVTKFERGLGIRRIMKCIRRQRKKLRK